MFPRQFTVPTRHGPLAGSRLGAGPPLVLLAANGHDTRDFDAVRGPLATQYETLALDWPGTGNSPPLERPESATAARFAEMLEDATAALALEGAAFIGHSVGGFTAARLAARRPDRVRLLVLVDPGGFMKLDMAGRAFCRIKGTELVTGVGEGAFARWHAKRRTPQVHEMLRRIDAARRGRAYVATVAAVWRSFASADHDLRAEAERIVCPTLLVWGARDPVIPVRIAGASAHGIIPGSRLVTLPTGHSPFVEAPEDFLAEVLPFLDAHRPGACSPRRKQA